MFFLWQDLMDYKMITDDSKAERNIHSYPMLMFDQKLRILTKLERKGKRRQEKYLIGRANRTSRDLEGPA